MANREAVEAYMNLVASPGWTKMWREIIQAKLATSRTQLLTDESLTPERRLGLVLARNYLSQIVADTYKAAETELPTYFKELFA